MKHIRPGSGFLPIEAQELLRAALRQGRPGSLERMSAIDRAYRRIEEDFPEYLKPENERRN